MARVSLNTHPEGICTNSTYYAVLYAVIIQIEAAQYI